jgi:hypothetical protein
VRKVIPVKFLPGRARETAIHRAVANATDDRYATCTCLEQRLDHVTANGEQKVGFLRDKFGGQFRKSIRHAIGIAEDDFDVAAIDESGLRERVLQRLIDRPQFGVAKYQPPDPGQRFLRTPGTRPSRHRAANNCNELAPLHPETLTSSNSGNLTLCEPAASEKGHRNGIER